MITIESQYCNNHYHTIQSGSAELRRYTESAPWQQTTADLVEHVYNRVRVSQDQIREVREDPVLFTC